MSLTPDLQELADKAYAPNTLRAYEKAWNGWCVWWAADVRAAQPSDVARYLAELHARGMARASIALTVAALSHNYKARNHVDVTKDAVVAAVWRGIRRELRHVPQRKARALRLAELRAMLATCVDGMTGARDAALLSLGWWSALRRSEIVALTTDDVVRVDRGWEVTIRASKGDQEGEGRILALAPFDDVTVCPVRALGAWERHLWGRRTGPMFTRIFARHVIGEGLSDDAVGYILVRRAQLARVDPSRLTAHSLRHGWVAEAADRKLSIPEILGVTRHASSQSLDPYLMGRAAWENSPTTLFSRRPT